MYIDQGRMMSETLTNSGPLEADTAPAAEKLAENAVTLEGSAEIALPAVTAQVEQTAAANLPTSEAQEAALLKEEEARAAIVGEEQISLPLSGNVKESSENNAKVDEVVPESATPVDTSLLEVAHAASTSSSGSASSVGGLAGRASRLRRKKVTFRISLPLLVLLLVSILVPAIMAIDYGVGAYTTYTALRDEANDGLQHLLNVKTVFTGSNAHLTGFLDKGKLQRAQKEFSAAHQDFQQVEYTLDHSTVIANVVQYLPQYRSQITTAQAIGRIGIDVTNIGQELVHAALILAPTFRGPLLNATDKPLITPDMLVLARTTIDRILPFLSDIQTQSRMFSLDALPASVSAHQRAQLAQLMQMLPQAQTDLVQVRDLLDAFGWMLGVNEPRKFLVQTMDRGELRPTGGFTGQYGELSINGGRVAPFSLRDISLVEYVDNSPTLGLLAPPQYRSWWPFANWGLRDSNLSADFPTSAQIALSKYRSEVGHPVDGVIMFTPFLVEHVLQVIGPILVPGYNDTITAQNIEERLHYYQQDNAGLAKQVVYQPDDKATSSRKRFTSLLAHMLLDRVRHAPPDEIIAIAQQMLHDLKTKDLQIYVTNPQLEALLVHYGDAAQVDRSTTHDGLYVVQANISASKASQYVRTIMHDTVTLNADGGATHLMQLRLVYNQVGPVYGYDTYHDYVRVYVPPTSKFLWGDGFDTGTPLCGALLAACPQSDVYPKHELQCTAGQYQPGAAAPSISDEDGGHWHPLDTVGPPTNFRSDEAGRAMFGGWVVVPKNCTMTVTLSWYVPPTGHTAPYSLLVQRQAGTFPELDLTILPTPGNCGVLKTAGQYFDGILNEDTSFALKTVQAGADVRSGCYPQPGV
ncbi:MAG TPA: hypothetical protein DCK85_15135 [Ktedonobacter sp.]|nr:hypothetical protein [Ktedonobacter sp.]